MSNQDEEEARHLLHQQYERPGQQSYAGTQDDITAATAGIRSRLDMLASINEANILIPGGPQERYHAIIEEAYAALGLIETQVEELRTELEYQHKRLDEIRDARLSQEQEQSWPLGNNGTEKNDKDYVDFLYRLYRRFDLRSQIIPFWGMKRLVRSRSCLSILFSSRFIFLIVLFRSVVPQRPFPNRGWNQRANRADP